jgi:hypothetical protein
LGLDAESGVNAILDRRDAQRAVLTVRVDDDARHLVTEQLLDEDPEKVALPAARLGEDADVALDELVDVKLDAEAVISEETDVGAGVRVMLEAEDLGDERLLGTENVRPGTERDRGELHQPLLVAVADDPRRAEEAFVDVPLVTGQQRARGLESEVAFPLQVVQLAEHLAVELVHDGQVVAALDRAPEAELELAEADVPKDASDLFHGAFDSGPRI